MTDLSGAPIVFKEMDETHSQGIISLENTPKELFENGIIKGDLGIQIATNGKVWVCINGIAFLRFRPYFEGEKTDE